ncbi:thymidine phosphorylase [Acholeplasma sp. OttesenSCG-928-E16]|nr:thymidine phosphorylase [Acholeplasma sp. OttesenSCG-928-E16]
MHILDILIKKRDGYKLTKEEIDFIITEYTKGRIPDYQMSAFLMAVFFRGMDDEESTSLALSMRDSGDVFDLSDINGIKVDKHSTGGVGDKVTLVLGPLLAHHGAKFAKMSGRGLGHTGGTIDKLESIPGFNTVLGIDEFKDQVNRIGLAVVGQSGDIAPADKKIYALRDVTATVESIPLIASSIMSKKLASGADCICLDVKVGSGAFMKNMEDAEKLARLMVEIGQLAKREVTAILTNMDEPLGHKIGNGLEVLEAIETLKGNGPADLVEVTIEIGAHLLLDSKIESDFDVAKDKLRETLKNGSSLYKLKEMIEAQGGDPSVVDNPNMLYGTAKKYELKSISSGYVEKMDALSLGLAGMRLGAGREKKDDQIIHDVGLDLIKKIGDMVSKGETIAIIYHHERGLEEAKKLILDNIIVGPKRNKTVLIEKTIVNNKK